MPLTTAGQPVHKVPQELTLVSGAQMPLQSCEPEGQVPLQAEPDGTQLPAHNIWPLGQLPPQLLPSQVALPPLGTGQAVQLAPQPSTLVLLTQLPLQA